MKKIKISVKKEENDDITISNDLGKQVLVKSSNGILNASDLFVLFNNGIDVIYSCEDEKVSEDEKGLNKVDMMFNDCLELINSIIADIQKKISELNQSNGSE